MALTKLQARGDRDLKRLDRELGQAATYYAPAGTAITGAITDGATTVTYTTTPNIKVRSAGLSSVELAALRNAGYSLVEAVWYMRSAYVAEVLPGQIIQVGAFYYEVIENGATLDDLGQLWTIMTRRRPAV